MAVAMSIYIFLTLIIMADCYMRGAAVNVRQGNRRRYNTNPSVRFSWICFRRYGRRHRDSSTCKPFSRRRPIEPLCCDREADTIAIVSS